MSLGKLHRKIFRRLFLGRPLSFFRDQARRFVEEHLDAMSYPPVFERLEAARQRGDSVVILSNSPDFLVEEIARRFGVEEWRATVYDVDKHGSLCTISQLMQGCEKRDYLAQLRLRLKGSCCRIDAYSDSYLDLPFLEAADTAIGVNPDARLRKICRQNGWKIIL